MASGVCVATVAAVLLACTVGAEAAAQASACHVVLGQYQAIKTGMSLRSVIGTFGCPGKPGVRVAVGDQVRQSYSWRGKGTYGANVSLTFTNGRLSDKSQLGLQ